jgi:SAM-dependent methyltransferase
LNTQREQWQTTFASRPDMFGVEPSYAARRALSQFQREGKRKILELGSGQGRDTLFFLRNGFEICAVDYSEKGLEDLRNKAKRLGMGHAVQTVRHDVRRLLPFKANTFDACFSHMLYCMALTTAELETLSEETRRVLKPGGLNLYTVRNTHDPEYCAGIHRGGRTCRRTKALSCITSVATRWNGWRWAINCSTSRSSRKANCRNGSTSSP